ncbi:MAG: tRNA pseudouridine(13) synthase TruD [Planctomycetota bacterium]
MKDPPAKSEGSAIDDNSIDESAIDERHGAAEEYTLCYQRPNPTSYPNLAPDLPPIGGKIRTTPEDFHVVEIPLYHFSGEGEHCYVTVEKTNRTTLQVRDFLGMRLGLRGEEIGFAGFKDRRAVAQQTFSFPRDYAGRLQEVETEWLKVIDVTYHKNKIRTGHLSGNRFSIRLRDLQPGALEIARQHIDRLQEGIPNFYGPQRFGPFNDGHLIGSALLHRNPREAMDIMLGPKEGIEQEFRDLYVRGKYLEALKVLPRGRTCEAAVLHTLHRFPNNFRAAARRIPRQLKRMFFSAYQSFLFNWCLRERMEWGANAFARPVEGDLAYLHPKGNWFIVEDVAEARERAAQEKLSPSGPMFGRKMPCPTGREHALECAVLNAEKMRPQSFLSHVKGLHLKGTRRPYRIPALDVELSEEDQGRTLVLGFTLPPGSYATILLEQLMGAGQTRYQPEENGSGEAKESTDVTGPHPL